MYKPQHHFRNFFSGALFGGALGAVAAMFFSTPKGKKIRKELKGKYHEFTEHLEEYNPLHKKNIAALKKKTAPIKKRIKMAKKEINAFKKKAAPMKKRIQKAKKKITSFKRKNKAIKRRG